MWGNAYVSTKMPAPKIETGMYNVFFRLIG